MQLCRCYSVNKKPVETSCEPHCLQMWHFKQSHLMWSRKHFIPNRYWRWQWKKLYLGWETTWKRKVRYFSSIDSSPINMHGHLWRYTILTQVLGQACKRRRYPMINCELKVLATRTIEPQNGLINGGSTGAIRLWYSLWTQNECILLTPKPPVTHPLPQVKISRNANDLDQVQTTWVKVVKGKRTGRPRKTSKPQDRKQKIHSKTNRRTLESTSVTEPEESTSSRWHLGHFSDSIILKDIRRWWNLFGRW